MDTFSSKILLNGLPVAWVHKIGTTVVAADPDNGVEAHNKATITELWKFDNLQSSSYKVLNAQSEESGENLDITRADGAIIRFPKKSVVISGTNGNILNSDDSSSGGTGLGEITLVTNEAPMNATRWTSFIKEVKDNQSSLFLVTIPTGISYDDNDKETPTSDGYVHMVGKLTSDIEGQGDANPSSLTLTFASNIVDATESDLKDIKWLEQEITWKLGKDVDNPTLKPEAISEGEEQSLIDGDIVIVPAT